jgi:pimeloyl-ACP methyl ester carboxylesterase
LILSNWSLFRSIASTLSKVAEAGDYVSGEYRFEILRGVSHRMPEEQPDTVADLLLDWFATHPT